MKHSILVLLCVSVASARTLYVDPVKGNAANFGSSAASAWKSFDKLAGLPFGPGDKMLVVPGYTAPRCTPTRTA